MIGHALVDPFVAAADQREARAAREPTRPRLVEPAAARRQQIQRPGRFRVFDRGEQRLGTHHHAGPAAEGLVVDGAMAIGRGVTRIVQPHVEQTNLRGAPDERHAQRRVEVLAKDREHVDAKRRHSSSNPSGSSTVTTPSACAVDEHHGHQHTAVEHEQIVGRIRLDRHDMTEGGAGAIAHLGPDHFVHPDLALGRRAELVARHQLVAQRLGRVTVVDACEVHDPTVALAPGPLDHQRAVAHVQHASGREALVAIRDGHDADLAVQPVRTSDAADFQPQRPTPRRRP